MQKFVWIGVVLLGVLHQDLWYWDDKSAVFGFMPMGLAYHAGYSIAAALIWAAAVKWAWPSHIEEWADKTPDPGVTPPQLKQSLSKTTVKGAPRD